MLLGGCLINLLQFADMLNHSFEPNCFFHWRFKDRMLEVMINAGKRIKKGDEVMSISILSIGFDKFLSNLNACKDTYAGTSFIFC